MGISFCARVIPICLYHNFSLTLALHALSEITVVMGTIIEPTPDSGACKYRLTSVVGRSVGLCHMRGERSLLAYSSVGRESQRDGGNCTLVLRMLRMRKPSAPN